MKKKLGIILSLAVLLPILLLSGCSKAIPLPDSMDQEKVSQAAQQIVAELLDGEYQVVADRFRADMKQEYSITADTVKAMMDTVAKAGAYISTEHILVLGGESKAIDEDYASVGVSCKHENGTVYFELSLDVNLELIGLAAKEK